MIPARITAPENERGVFRPQFIQHRGRRVLRLDYADLEPAELEAAFQGAGDVIAGEPPESLRVLTILHSRFDGKAIEALRRYAVANRPHVRSSAVVVDGFWSVIVMSIKLHERHDLRLFDTEEDALDWLVR
jgi:hypothetical protein